MAPSTFWSMTLREWTAAVEGYRKANTPSDAATVKPPTREEYEAAKAQAFADLKRVGLMH